VKPGDLDLFDPDTFSEGPPHDYFRMLRRESPVCWTPAPRAGVKCISALDDGYWVVSRYEDLVDVSRNPRIFSSHEKTAFLMDPDAESLPGLQAMLINMDPPHHVKYRRLVQRGFTPRMVRDLEPVIRRHARRIVDAVADRGHCEFVTELACELPMTLICELAGIPEADRERIFHWSNQLIGADDPDMSEGIDPGKASMEMWLYSNALAAEKREHPDGTLISKYVNGEINGERISEFELNNFFVLLSVAGNETTRNATTQFMRLMSEYPDAWQLLLTDVDRYLPLAIEEALRFAPPVMQFCRIALQDTEIRGTRIREGERVYLSYPSANRDEDVWDDPDRFDISRDPNPHITFGIGEHYCLGANLARMQLHCILREIATRLPDIRATAPPKLQRSNMIAGIKEMQVAFTPAA
jgi:cytochrome P450